MDGYIRTNITPDRMREIINAEQEGRLVVLPCKVGDTVWVVERGMDGEPGETSGYVFLTVCNDCVIVSPTINGSDDVTDILNDQVEQTSGYYHGDLCVFPAGDCYLTREAAEAALAEKERGSENA